VESVSRNRIADLQLRGNTSPLPVRVYWPGQHAPRPVPLLVFCSVGAGAGARAEAACRSLSEDAGLVVLSVSCAAGAPDGTTVLEWAAEHAAELGADPGRLLVAGEGAGRAVAAAVALEALAAGWPPVTLLTEPSGYLRRGLPAGSDDFLGPASSNSMYRATEEK
jgi:acetyl esterase